MTNKERVSKKPRVQDDLDRAWQHYLDYIESAEGDNADIDELQMILEILDGSFPKATTIADLKLDSRAGLVPVLMSVAHGILADYEVSQRLAMGPDDELEKSIVEHVTQSLEAFGDNALVWSQAANICRMQLIGHSSLSTVVAAYERAATAAQAVRTRALEVLEPPSTEEEREDGNQEVGTAEEEEEEEPPQGGGRVQEWIELLLLKHVAGVEFTVDDEDENGADEDDDEEKDISDAEEEDDEEGYWSTSAVEGTCRFMAAMLQSTLGQHEAARENLQAFDLTHRLHPNVWTGKTLEKSNEKDPVVAFRGVLPDNLYQRLCQVFGPDAAYWEESDYANRGYYSYFMDDIKEQSPQNLMQEAIFHHLLPLAQAQLAAQNIDETICGAEWWVHTRPIQARLGHNLHFDTDESLLFSENEITHPTVSAVLYLTGESLGGATIVLDQTPHSTELSEYAWRSAPSDNSLMIFPGDRLHGVLPCPGKAVTGQEKVTQPLQVENLFSGKATNGDSDSPAPHRLTLLVGFWTRRVPDRMKEQKIYGACGPMPEEGSWVEEISKGYDNFEPTARTKIPASTVPKVSPAWDALAGAKPEEALPIPRGVDHRFFVNGAPRCFYDSMFERHDLEEEEDEESDESEE
jgi:hypothetical protein